MASTSDAPEGDLGAAPPQEHPAAAAAALPAASSSAHFDDAASLVHRHTQRIIPFSHGAFAVDDATLAVTKKTWTIVQRLEDAIGQCTGSRSRSQQAEDQRKEKEGADDDSDAAPAVYHPSVHQVQVGAYRRHMFGSNRIRSARYTLVSFLPLNLWEQIVPWNKPANTYFIIVSTREGEHEQAI